jgi:hypothetical protein
MTADDRATLAKVERLLAEAIPCNDDGYWPAVIAARVLVAGLLAEPQPDIVIDSVDFEAARRDPRVAEFHRMAAAYAESLIAKGHCRCHLVVNCPDGLAEPQVNPSEAKDDLERGGYIEAPKRLLPRSVSAASFDPYMLAMSAKTINAGVIHEVVVKAWVVLWLLERAGLLAEGEESREP